MRNAELEEAQAGIKIAERNINNLRYADDTTLTAESEELCLVGDALSGAEFAPFLPALTGAHLPPCLPWGWADPQLASSPLLLAQSFVL